MIKQIDVLLAIKPEFAEKILSGEKRFEYRKGIFKHPDVRKVVLYASSPVKMVVGEFDYEGYIEGDPEAIYEQTKEFAGISKERYLEYFGKRTKAYAIKVGKVRRYDPPLPLETYGSTKPPQFFSYLLTIQK